MYGWHREGFFILINYDSGGFRPTNVILSESVVKCSDSSMMLVTQSLPQDVGFLD